MSVDRKRFIRIFLVIAVFLSIPLIAMQFTEEVSWEAGDFLVMGLLLAGALFIGDMVIRRNKKRQYRVLLYLVILVIFLLIWAELAVGIFGSPLTES